MAKIEITRDDLVLTLTPFERLASFRWGLRVPLSAVSDVQEDPKAIWKLGLRIPGTMVPWLIAAGTYWKPKNKQFAIWKKGETPVVISLKGQVFQSLVLGSKDPQVLKQAIDSAIQLQK